MQVSRKAFLCLEKLCWYFDPLKSTHTFFVTNSLHVGWGVQVSREAFSASKMVNLRCDPPPRSAHTFWRRILALVYKILAFSCLEMHHSGRKRKDRFVFLRVFVPQRSLHFSAKVVVLFLYIRPGSMFPWSGGPIRRAPLKTRLPYTRHHLSQSRGTIFVLVLNRNGNWG